MREEPKLSDYIYEEIRQCEEYALMNLVTFEAAIRNNRVREILSLLDSVSAEQKLDSMLENTYDVYSDLKKELKEDYFIDYNEYVEYMKTDKKEYQLHVRHDEGRFHTHILSLPLKRPKMAIPHKDSSINIKIPMYHIQPKYLKAYYERLYNEHLEVVKESKGYYALEELFYDEVDEPKVIADKYAEKFFVWDYVQWWEEVKSTYTPDSTAQSLYYKIGNMIGANVNDKTGRNTKVEKLLEQMNPFIDGGYKKFYTPS